MKIVEDGTVVVFPTSFVLKAIENLSDEDKEEFATAIVDMIVDDSRALSVLKNRCIDCGRKLKTKENGMQERCYCIADW